MKKLALSLIALITCIFVSEAIKPPKFKVNTYRNAAKGAVITNTSRAIRSTSGINHNSGKTKNGSQSVSKNIVRQSATEGSGIHRPSELLKDLSKYNDLLKKENDRQYNLEREQTILGLRRNYPQRLMINLSLAREKNDTVYAKCCLRDLLKNGGNPQEIIEYISEGLPVTDKDAAFISTVLAKMAYVKRVKYPDSVYIAADDRTAFEAICGKYNEALLPLVSITFADADSVTSAMLESAIEMHRSGKLKYEDTILVKLYEQLADALYSEEKYEEFFNIFISEEVWPYTQKNINLLLPLYHSVILTERDNSDYNYLLELAREIDPDIIDKYIKELYANIVKKLCEAPVNTEEILNFISVQDEEEQIDWANAILSGLSDKLLGNDEFILTWDWSHLEDFPEEDLQYIDAIAQIGQKYRQKFDLTFKSEGTLLYQSALMRLIYDDFYPAACEDIEAICKVNDALGEYRYFDPVNILIIQAYLKGHGLDNPKAVVKYLEENSKILETEHAFPESEWAYYDYLYEAYKRLGKTKKAEKALTQRDTIILN